MNLISKMKLQLAYVLMYFYTPPIKMGWMDFVLCRVVVSLVDRAWEMGDAYSRVCRYQDRLYFRERGAKCGGICRCDGRVEYSGYGKFVCPVYGVYVECQTSGCGHFPDDECEAELPLVRELNMEKAPAMEETFCDACNGVTHVAEGKCIRCGLTNSKARAKKHKSLMEFIGKKQKELYPNCTSGIPRDCR